MVMTLEKEQTLSLEAFLDLPETQPASEYAHGIITQKTRPEENIAVYKPVSLERSTSLLKSPKLRLHLPSYVVPLQDAPSLLTSR
jgi:Uma2 family endonuclease